MKPKLILSLAGMLFIVPICFGADTIKLEDLSTVIQKTIQLQVGAGKLSSIEKYIEDGGVVYDVEMARDGKTRDFSVSEDGELLASEVFLPEIPAVVQKTIQAQVGKGHLEDIYKAADDGEISYDVEVTRDGKTRSFTVSEKGEITDEQVFLNELPAVVRKAVHKNAAGGSIGEITRSKDEGQDVYDVEIAKGAVTRTVTFDSDGVLLSEEEPAKLSDASEVAQNKIKSLVGNGKMLGLTKVTEDGAVSYDVDILHGSTRKTLSISADGELLDDEK